MVENLTCNNLDCQVSENGSCLQGHDPVNSCPNYGEHVNRRVADVTGDGDTSSKIERGSVFTKVTLASGQRLVKSDVDALLLKRYGRVIAIVGETSSGKSTLLCAIYDRFQRGTFADRSFAASSTLNGFEQLVHLSRSVSGASVPDTRRTSLSEGLHFYHLATSSIELPGVRFYLFLADRAGEVYRSGINRPEEFKQLPELHFARVVVVLVDGARLGSPSEKYTVLDTARRTVRAMIDSESLTENQHIQIVLTKRDRVARADNENELINSLKTVVDRLRDDFGAKVASINYFETAARDPKKSFDPAYGCDELFKSWIGAPDPLTHQVKDTLVASTQFDRLTLSENNGLLL